MMNYEEFKQKVQNEFKNYLGEEYKDAEVFIREVTKVNMQVDQMSLLNLHRFFLKAVFHFYFDYLLSS